MAKYCGKCKKTIKSATATIQCTNVCKKYFHLGCTSTKKNVNLKKLSADELKKWVCSNCRKQTTSSYVSEHGPSSSASIHVDFSEMTNESVLSLQLYEEIEQIKQRQKELKILIETERLKNENPEEYFTEDLEEKINNLAKEHCQMTEASAVQDIIIPNLQLSDTLFKILYANHAGSSSKGFLDLLTDDDSKKLNGLLEEITRLSSETLGLRREVTSLEDETLQIKLKMQQISAEKLALMKKLEEKKGKEENQPEKESVGIAITNLQQEEKKLIRLINVKNYLLHKIIAFSGLNWAQDEELKNIVLDTGKSLDFQLSEIQAQKS